MCGSCPRPKSLEATFNGNAKATRGNSGTDHIGSGRRSKCRTRRVLAGAENAGRRGVCHFGLRKAARSPFSFTLPAGGSAIIRGGTSRAALARGGLRQWVRFVGAYGRLQRICSGDSGRGQLAVPVQTRRGNSRRAGAGYRAGAVA